MNLNKRLTDIENRLNPTEKPTAWIAMIDVDGSAVLTHEEKKIHFENRDDLNKYVVEQGINKRFLLVVEMVNAQSKEL